MYENEKVGTLGTTGGLPFEMHCCQFCDPQGCGDCDCPDDDKDGAKNWSKIQKAVQAHMEAGPFHTK